MMKPITRWTMSELADEMVPDVHGEWVRHEDHEAVLAGTDYVYRDGEAWKVVLDGWVLPIEWNSRGAAAAGLVVERERKTQALAQSYGRAMATLNPERYAIFVGSGFIHRYEARPVTTFAEAFWCDTEEECRDKVAALNAAGWMGMALAAKVKAREVMSLVEICGV